MFGVHQPGVATPVLDHVAFAALDVTAESRGELRELLQTLTLAAQRLMENGHRSSDGRGPAGAVTVTLGLGCGIFDERFGLTSRRPVALCELPAFTGDTLDPSTCGGDLCIVACAHTGPQAAEALGHLVALSKSATRVRWSQRGFLRRLATDPPEGRPRNLLGFKDATGNPRRAKDLDRHVWVTGRERTWMLGGTFLVVRKIRILLDAWHTLALDEQERIVGRHRDSGAPLGRTHEFEPMPMRDDTIPRDAHARLAAPQGNGGLTVLRRGYSYDNGRDNHGEHDAGLLLLLYQRDPRRQFIPLQRRLAEHDALNRYTRPTGSSIFALPPGAPPGQPIAHSLLA
jgi:deferrochelatase/peroxidase EfeB